MFSDLYVSIAVLYMYICTYRLTDVSGVSPALRRAATVRDRVMNKVRVRIIVSVRVSLIRGGGFRRRLKPVFGGLLQWRGSSEWRF